MRNRAYSLVVLILLLICNSFAFAQSPQIQTGLSWLTSTQTSTGNWPEVDTTDYYSTAAALDAVSILEPSNPAYTTGFQWMTGQIISPTDYLSRRIIALKRAGLDVSSELEGLLLYRNADGGWGGETSYLSDNIDTALALQAFKAASYSDTMIISQVLAYLTTNQNSDGGWGFVSGDASTAYMTAMVLRLLSGYSSTFSVQSSLQNASAYLLTKQNTDGGFGSSPSTVYETALSIISLIESGQGSTLSLQNAINYLTSTQLPSGSWNDDPYSTALALQALAKVKPNLALTSSDITFSQFTPTQGQSVTITATVHNSGLAQAENVLVQMFDGDPAAGGAQVGPNLVIASIAPGGSANAEVVYTMTTNTDRHAIYVKVDPFTAIDEHTKTDNTAVNYFTVFSPPDLIIDSSEIRYSPSNPTVDMPLTITFIVRNVGEKEAVNVPLRLYRDLPENGGTVINNYNIPSLQGHGFYQLTATINNPIPGLNMFYLIADPDNAIPELDETNNQGMNAVTVAGTSPTDLAVTTSNIGFLFPSGSQPGNGFTINAVITNTGSTDIQTSVSFYKGDPKTGGTLIGNTSLTVPAIGIQTATVNWTVPQDNPLIYVVVDPNNLVSEADKTNNTAYRAFNGSIMLPDLSVNAADVSIQPACLTPQSNITVNAIFHNWGGNTNTVSGFSSLKAHLYDGAPENGGVNKGAFGFLIDVNPGGASSWTDKIGQMTSRAGFVNIGYLTAGTHDLYVVLDPTNQVNEYNEDNNRAVLRVTVSNTCDRDLFITSKDITFSPSLPAVGSQVNITAIVHNTGSRSESFYTSFYNGNPATGGKLIQKVNTALLQESIGPVSAQFTMTSGVPDIYVVVDAGNQVQEKDETNNIASRTIDTYKIDLSVSSGDITLTPTAHAKGDPATVKVTVHGTGSTDLAGTLRLYEGTPEHGRLIGSQDVATHGNQAVPVAFPSYVYPGDGVTLTAIIENVTPAEVDPANNRASATFGEHIQEGATNEGADFWIAWPPVSYDTASIAIQSKHTAQVIITIPLSTYYSGGQQQIWSTRVTVSPGSPVIVPLTYPTYGKTSNTASVIENKAIHIVSDNDVSVVFHTPADAGVADDAYLALPVNMLGTRYYVLSYSAAFAINPYKAAAYTIAATEDNTHVDIPGGFILLNQGQTYVYNVNAADITSTIDLSGTFIQSDKPIAVIASTLCSNITPDVGTCDSLLEQMLPVSLLGTDYYTAPLYSPESGDRYRILAVKDNTQVSMKDKYRINTVLLNAGQWTEFEDQEAMHITSNHPIMTAQYAKGIKAAQVGDPFQMTIIPMDKLKTEYRFFSYPGYGGYNLSYPQYTEQGNFVTIIAPEPDTIAALDGVTVTDGWLPLPDKGSYVVVHIDEGEHIVTSDKPIAVSVHGYGAATSYGYPAGLSVSLGNLKLDNPALSPATPSVGQLVTISGTLTNEGDKSARDVIVRAYNGDPANGGTQIGQEVYFAIVDPKESKTVLFTWDSYGYGGTNKLYIVADPDNAIKESNESDNTAMLPIALVAPAKPDLVVTSADITLSKNTAGEGELVVLTAKIKNRGSDVGAIPVSLFLGDPASGGRLLENKFISQKLPLIGEAVIEFNVNTLGFASTNDVRIVIDPENIIDELVETNNSAARVLTVNRRKLTVGVVTNITQYPAQSDVGINISVQNLNTVSWSGTGDIYIQTTAGQQIAHVGTFTLGEIRPWGLEGWKYRVPVTVNDPRDLRDAVGLTAVDFDVIFASLGLTGKTVDQNSIRIFEFDGAGNAIGEKQARPVFQTATTAKITWLMDGLTPKNTPRYFSIYFDTTENGLKPGSAMTKVAISGRLVGFTDNSGKVYVMESNPDGTFGTYRVVDDVSPSNTDYTQGLVLDDFNNDGFIDIITGSRDNGELYSYQNKADGTNTFLPKSKIGQFTGVTYVTDMASADFNNDGNKDFVVNLTRTSIDLFLGNGDGTFTQHTITPPPLFSFYDFWGKSANDMDDDGYQDFIIADGGKIYVYRGNGDGTFLPPVMVGNVNYSATYGLITGDFDGDGKRDIIATQAGYNYTFFWKGNGDGTFAAQTRVTSLDNNSYSTFDTGDFNGDGRLDVIANQYSPGGVVFYPGNGDGTFGAKTRIATIYSSLGLAAYLGSVEVHPALGLPETVPFHGYNYVWNTGNTYAGSYMVHVVLSETGNVVAENRASFDILPDRTTVSSVITDRVSYAANQTVTLTSMVASSSVNYFMENLAAKINIQNPVDSSQVYTETKAISTLMPEASFTFKSYWNTLTYTPGTYPVTLEVKDASGTVIATGSSQIVISGTVKPSALLKGQVSVDKQSVFSGESISVSYSVTNVGNIDLSSVNLSVQTVHVVNQTVYDTIPAETPLPMGGVYPGAGVIDTTTYSAKDYLVILRAKIGDIEETLAGTYFRVEGAPTAPSLSLPGNGSDVETFTPVLIVNNASDPNDDKLTYEFEVYSDSGLTNQVTGASGQGTVWTVPVSLTENQTYYWRSRAYDGKLYGSWMTTASFRVNVANDAPTAPGISSPGDGSSVDTLTSALVITNAFDPDSASLTYNFDVALDPDFTQIVATITGVTSGPSTGSGGTTPWQVPAAALTENAYYYWRAQADDWFITGPWMTTAKFFVNTANDAPTAPVITSPVNNAEITTTSPDIVLINSTDPDTAVLTYFFELDTVMTFDSPGVIRSGSLPEGQGTTLWHVDGLHDNTYYYVRAKASDGRAESGWTEQPVSFFVNTANDVPTVPVLANPSNGAGVNSFTPTLSMHNSTDLDKDVLTYEFEVYSDAALTSLVTSTTGVSETAQTTSWTVPVSLIENQMYYWRARAYDGELRSDWMTPTSFMVNTANDAPGAPKLHAPAEGSSLATLTPAFSVTNAVDPDSDILTYDFEVYAGDVLFQSITGVPEDSSGVTSAALSTALSDNTTYRWRVRAYDGDRHGAWMDMATFSIHIPVTTINATIDFDPNTLNKTSNGMWVVVYIEFPAGYRPADVDISTVRLEGTIAAVQRPCAVGDHDKDGIPDLMVKFKRSDVINLLPNGDKVTVRVTGTVGTTTFEGVDTIRVIP